MTARCDKRCTTTSLGRPRQRWLATTVPPMMCLRVSASHAGLGMDSRGNTSRFELVGLSVVTLHLCVKRVRNVNHFVDESYLRILCIDISLKPIGPWIRALGLPAPSRHILPAG